MSGNSSAAIDPRKVERGRRLGENAGRKFTESFYVVLKIFLQERVVDRQTVDDDSGATLLRVPDGGIPFTLAVDRAG